MRHHAFVIECEAEEGIASAHAWIEKELGIKAAANPDVVVLRHGLLSVADARKISEMVAGAPFAGESKAVIITADRAYHEAQNALLKVFEEPPAGIYLFLVMPSLGGLLPTLRSRVVELLSCNAAEHAELPEIAETFMQGTKEKRSAVIKKLSSGKDEEERREHRSEAITIVNGIETALVRDGVEKQAATLFDIATLRSYLYDRSAPVRMILEHLSIVFPKDLSGDK
jgi:hypothetical protein